MVFFLKAKPVWAKDQQLQMNMTCRFEGTFSLAKGEKPLLRVAGATIYRAWLNNQMVAWGPARCGHGCYRVDEWPLDAAKEGKNELVIEVAGYNVNCYAYLDQPSFLQAEVVENGRVLLYTAEDGNLACRWDHTRVQRAQRYSFQRAFTEAYNLRAAPAFEEVSLQNQDAKRLTARGVPLPDLNPLPAQAMVTQGRVEKAVQPKPMFADRATVNIGETIKGFPPDQLDAFLSDELGAYDFIPEKTSFSHPLPLAMAERGYAIYRFARNTTGFLSVNVETAAPCTLYLIFDERLTNGDIDYLRLGCVNAVRWTLNAGRHQLLTMEPYTLQYVKIACPDGAITIRDVSMVACQANLPLLPNPAAHDRQLGAVYEAAAQTLLQNSLDIFMDCPSRERAGWLCDSFFTARGEKQLTGANVIERSFLENFLIPDHFSFLPEGMLPMCYPADHNDGNFIPNWAMWLVLQLEDYWRRTGDRTLVDQFKPRVMALLDYFKPFENEDGLLENLDGWVFLDWSRANDPDLVCGVNYPSNMTYAAMLRAAAALYAMPRLSEKAEKLFTVIRRQSFNGLYFMDHAARVEGKLIPDKTATEACQSYAFFTGTATPDANPDLYQRFLHRFAEDGDQRPCPQNAFIGWYVRLAALEKYQAYEQIEQDLRGVFYPQAAATGTLWEQTTDVASLCHGFTAYAAALVAQVIGHKNKV